MPFTPECGGLREVAWGAAVAWRVLGVPGQVGLFAGRAVECGADLLLEGGELWSVVRADDAGFGGLAGSGVADEVGDAPVGPEAVPPCLLDFGVQVGQPRPPGDSQQHVAAGSEDAE